MVFFFNDLKKNNNNKNRGRDRTRTNVPRSLPTRPMGLVESEELFRLYKHVHLFLTRVKTSKPSNNEFELKISL